jgi:hypothetical protein
MSSRLLALLVCLTLLAFSGSYVLEMFCYSMRQPWKQEDYSTAGTGWLIVGHLVALILLFITYLINEKK